MRLQLPPSLKYPITVRALLKNPGDAVERTTPLLSYTYKTTVKEDNEFGEETTVEREFPAQLDSPIEGQLKNWFVTVGAVLKDNKNDYVEIEEPCSHSVQFHGLCTACGKDMTIVDYTSFSDSNRAPIAMSHDSTGLTVSQDEATRLEEETKRRLLKARRLSLVVDLDQTVIHATVDPTVGEWKSDPFNPNYEYVKDVQAFQLNDEIAGGRGCWYYLKMRPGLKDFLENMAKLYELHIYTMGTRAYAMNVAKIIDPDEKIFGGRILSRDESGSMTTKSLHRLFPVDTKMVVIIDDREDVWRWSPNLIKVKPYNFFVGIGDINSSFLPKRPTPAIPATETLILQKDTGGVMQGGNGDKAPTPTDLSTLEQLVTMGAGDDKLLLEEQAGKMTEEIKTQQEERPLAKQQQKLDEQDNLESAANMVVENGSDTSSDSGKHRHHLLHDDDRELMALEKNLRDVHRKFFEEYDKSITAVSSRVSQLRGERHPRKRLTDDPDNINLELVPDVKHIMPKMKAQTLKGCVLVFSGAIPLGIPMLNSDIGMWSSSFGAQLADKIGPEVTHLVAARARTAKVRTAASQYPHIKIVNLQWLYDSISNWTKMPEENYLVPINPEDRANHGMPGPLPMAIDFASQDTTLSEDEGETTGSELDVEDPQIDEEEFQSGLASIDWAEADAELEEFMAEDDSEDGDESDTSMTSTSSRRSERGRSQDVASDATARKGKRNRSSTPSTPAGETDSDNDVEKSNLAKRQKLARERTSSLRKVELAVPSPRPGSPGSERKSPAVDEGTGSSQNGAAVKTDIAGANDTDGDDDGWGDEENNLLAQLDGDGDDEEG